MISLVKKETVVRLHGGLFARAAANFVQSATRFRSEITLEKDGKKVNAKSIMGVMALAIASGQMVVMQADGPDEQQAIDQLSVFIEAEQLT